MWYELRFLIMGLTSSSPDPFGFFSLQNALVHNDLPESFVPLVIAFDVSHERGTFQLQNEQGIEEEQNQERTLQLIDLVGETGDELFGSYKVVP